MSLLEVPALGRRWCVQTYKRQNATLVRWHVGWLSYGPPRTRAVPGGPFVSAGHAVRVGVELAGPHRCVALYSLPPVRALRGVA